jgi:hypothetical protein
MTADEAGGVDVEGLSGGVGVQVRRETDIEAAPLLAVPQPGVALADGDAVAGQKQWRREVVPPCVAGEVRSVERVPAEVAPLDPVL